MLKKELMRWIISHNESPAFFYSGDVVRSGVKKLRDELNAKISFSTKANSHPFVLQELNDQVDEFNVTNITDLDRLLQLNIHPNRIAWIHPVVSSSTIKQVLTRGIRRFVIDDERGFNLLNSEASSLLITLRMKPPGANGTERSVIRFGNNPDILLGLAKKIIAAHHTIEALSFFVGVDGLGMDKGQPFISGIEAIADLHEKLSTHDIHVKTMNIGGGFPGSRRRFHQNHPDFFHHINNILQKTFDSDTHILCEPGRYLVEPCMLMATRVITDRELMGRRLIYLEASAYSGLFETAFIDSEDFLTVSMLAEGEYTSADLLGPIMDSFDVIKKNVLLPSLKENDFLFLENMGAYATGYSNQAEGLKTPPVIKLPNEFSTALNEVWYD